MAVKILSRAGASLADIYDVVGSISGLETLESREVTLAHEMGATIFSERFQTTFRRMHSGDVLQSTDIDLVLSTLPAAPTRLLALTVVTLNQSRIANVAVSVRSPLAVTQEIPIWAWDKVNFSLSRFTDEGVIVGRDILQGVPQLGSMPTFIGGEGQGSTMVHEVALHAQTNAFGAGTVNITAFLHFGFAFEAGLSSLGVPFPSW